MMRDKKRYILVETTSRINTDPKDFGASLYREIIRCIGESNYHRVNPKLVKLVGENRFIIKSSLEGTGQLILAFALIKRIGEAETAFYTLKSSGTIRALGTGPQPGDP
jgi:RNase P/RNase MRP subunit POP5